VFVKSQVLNMYRYTVRTQLYYTRCPTTYQTRHFFNNSKTNKDIATSFVQEYFCCVRNEEECVCSVCRFRCNIFIGFRIIKEMPGLVGSGTPYIIRYYTTYQLHVSAITWPLSGCIKLTEYLYYIISICNARRDLVYNGQVGEINQNAKRKSGQDYI
jgi:hypothetical protein